MKVTRSVDTDDRALSPQEEKTINSIVMARYTTLRYFHHIISILRSLLLIGIRWIDMCHGDFFSSCQCNIDSRDRKI